MRVPQCGAVRCPVVQRPAVRWCPQCGAMRLPPSAQLRPLHPPLLPWEAPWPGSCPSGGQHHTPAGTSAPPPGAHCSGSRPLPPSACSFSGRASAPSWASAGGHHPVQGTVLPRAGPGGEHVWRLHAPLAGHFRRGGSVAATISRKTSQASAGRACQAAWTASISWCRGLRGRPHPQAPRPQAQDTTALWSGPEGPVRGQERAARPENCRFVLSFNRASNYYIYKYKYI